MWPTCQPLRGRVLRRPRLSCRLVNSDGTTLAVSYAYDRLGRQTGITNGSAVTAFTLHDAGSVLIETYTNGPLNGWAVTNGYDTLLRRTNLVTLYNGVPQTVATNNFDAASRMGTISEVLQGSLCLLAR